MSERSIEHAGFTIQRRYGAAPERVFAAWADPAAKARWFAGPEEWDVAPHELDFREGGREVGSGGLRAGPVHTYRALYWLTLTEHGAFFDGLEDPALRRDGTGSLLDALASEVERGP
jgi:hypothetical protein